MSIGLDSTDRWQAGYHHGYLDGSREASTKFERIQTLALWGALAIAFALGLFWGEIWSFVRGWV